MLPPMKGQQGTTFRKVFHSPWKFDAKLHDALRATEVVMNHSDIQMILAVAQLLVTIIVAIRNNRK